MDSPPPAPRQWDPNAPSILWAYEIRRELAHFVNQENKEHRAQADIIEKLQKTIVDLSDEVHALRADFTSRYRDVLDRCEVLTAENNEMKERWESLSSTVDDLAKHDSQILARPVANLSEPRRKKRKLRRSIPIVPADEEDLSILSIGL